MEASPPITANRQQATQDLVDTAWPNPAPDDAISPLAETAKSRMRPDGQHEKTRERDPPRSDVPPCLRVLTAALRHRIVATCRPSPAESRLPSPGLPCPFAPAPPTRWRNPFRHARHPGRIPDSDRPPSMAVVPCATLPGAPIEPGGLLAGLPCRRRHRPAGSRTPTTDEDVAVRYPPGPVPAAWDSLPFRVRSLSYTLVAQAEMPRARLAEEPRAGGAAPPRSHRRRSTSSVWPGNGAASFGKHRI